MKHATQKMRDTGCDCDGCRLTGIIHTPNRNVAKVEAAGYRYVMQRAVASGTTISELARISGVSRHELTTIWYGRREHIWQSTAEKLRTALLSLIPEGS